MVTTRKSRGTSPVAMRSPPHNNMNIPLSIRNVGVPLRLQIERDGVKNYVLIHFDDTPGVCHLLIRHGFSRSAPGRELTGLMRSRRR